MNPPPGQPFPHPRSDPPGSPVAVEAFEDAGSQALSDALKSSFAIIKVVMVVLLIVFLGSGFFTVGPQQKAIKLRFGRPVGADERALLGPGPHWAFPYPIDEVVSIPMGEVQTVSSSIGWYAVSMAQQATGEEPPPGEALNPARDGYVLTADGNIIHVRGTLRYRIEEPGLAYTFNFAAASNAVQEAFNHAIVFAAAHYTVDDAWARDTAGFREKVRLKLEELIRQQGLGLVVEQIELKAIVPRQLTEAFDAVLEAEVKRSKLMNEAKSYATETVSRAKATAAARINAGENERTLLVEFVAAEATNFLALLPAYQRNPELFLEQRRSEVLQRILTNAQLKLLLPEQSKERPTELRLLLGRPPEKQKAAPPAAAEEHGH